MGQPKAVKINKEPRIQTPELKQLGVLAWDSDNLYPQRRRTLVADSATAQYCLFVYNRYVMGKGLADTDLYKAVVNSEGMTTDALLRRLIADKGTIGGVAVQFNYNSLGEKTEVNYIPIDDCRISIGKDRIFVHPNWGKRKDLPKFDRKDVVEYHVYDPSPEVVIQQAQEAGGWAEYKGQVLFWTPTGLTYPVAIWDAAAVDVDTEPETALFRNRTVKNNFVPSQTIVVPPVESSETDGEKSLSYVDVITETVQSFQGAENAASVMVIEKGSPEDEIVFEKPDMQHFDGMYDKTVDKVDVGILRGFKMPRQLILEGDGIFSSGAEFDAARAYYNEEVTSDDRLQMEELLRTIFENWEYDICPSGDYSIIPFVIRKTIPQEYFPYFDKNEIRESLGYDPIEDDPSATKKTLAEIIGVGGVQALTAVLADPALTPEQKRGTLEVVFGLDKDQVDKLLGIITQR